MNKSISRRDFLRASGLTLLGAAGATMLAQAGEAAAGGNQRRATAPLRHGGHLPGPTGEVDHARNGFNPSDVLTDFDTGKISTLSAGRILREFTLTSLNKTLEVMPGMDFPAWTFNGRIPGPTLRCTEGDRVRVHFANGSDHAHTIHFHGIHSAEMDGVPGTGPGGSVEPGQTFTYEFDAEPFGLHLYHCHVFPLARHIAKGLYGAFIIDPKEGRPPVDHEFVMVMHGLDVDFDDENDFYAVNGIPFHYQLHPIQFRVGEKVRIYLVNILEFDLINSIHIHANFFHYYPTGTSLTPGEYTDTIMQTQAQRGILEFSYKFPGTYMFHAHNTEFAELGWTGMFAVLP